MLFTLFLWTLLLQLSPCFAPIGIDVSTTVRENTFHCMKDKGFSFAIIRGYRSIGRTDANAVTTMQNGLSVGIRTEAYHFPCMGKVPPQVQANETLQYLGKFTRKFWIDIETNPSNYCKWLDPKSNCVFLRTLVSSFQSLGADVGIYASAYMWKTIFGSLGACSEFSTLDLWYAHWDNQKSFVDFKTFGGWTSPKIKQYSGTVSLCGASVDLNWQP